MNIQSGQLPVLSVVVVCLYGRPVLERCLQALSDRVPSPAGEIVVVGPEARVADTVDKLRPRYPGIRWVAASDQTTVPQMRSLGIEAARGQSIALIEDDCVISESWWAAAVRKSAEDVGAMGGPIEPGDYRKPLDWAVFFCEYGRFSPPFSGIVPALPGNNVIYRRADLLALLADGGVPVGTEVAGFYEVFAHARLLAQGRKLLAEPELMVKNVNSWAVRHVTKVPFLHGRGFAAMRTAGGHVGKRALLAGLSGLLPWVIVVRLLRGVLQRGRCTARFLIALPWIGLFAVSWSAGELVGYVLGPGNSLEEWR